MVRWDHNLPKNGLKWPKRPWNPVLIGGYNGEANFIYPAPAPDQEPNPSIRLENIRDVFEDYDMLAMLRQVRPQATPQEQKRIDELSNADSLMADSCHYSQDPALLRAM